MVSADPFCTAKSSLLDHCIERNHHQQRQHQHGRASVQFSVDKNSTSTFSSSSSSSPSPVPTGSPPHSNVPQRSKAVMSRYKSPVPDSASRYRSSTPSNLPSTLPRRFASPSLERSPLNATPPSKRAVSAERRRPSPTRTCLESKLASVANGDGSSALRPRRNPSSASVARSDLLWPTSRNLCSSTEAEFYSHATKSPVKARHESRGRVSSNLSSDHTLKPPPNSAQRLSDQRRMTPERKGTPLRRRSSDQLENAKPPEGMQSKPEQVLKHRWSSSLSTLKVYGTALSKSVDLGNDREKSTGRGRSVIMSHSRPTSFSSQMIARVLPNTSRILSHTMNEGPSSSVLRTAARKLSVEHKSKISDRDSPVKSGRGHHGTYDASGLSATLPRSGNSLDFGRYSAEEAVLASDNFTTDGTQCGAKGFSTPTRCLSDLSAGNVRAALEGHRLQNSTAESAYYSLTAAERQLATRQRLALSLDTRTGYSPSPPWPGSPNHLSPACKAARHASLSPIRISLGSSSFRGLPSPAVSGHSSALQFLADLRKSRKGLSQVEAIYLHRILHNRLLQWRFANARANFLNTTHRQAGEKLLFSVWAKTAEIRKSVTSKRIKLQQAWQAHKINRILWVQGAKLEKWASIQLDHSNALSGAVEALEAAVLRIPVNEGIKADTHAVKEAMTSAVDLVHVLKSSVNCVLPKMEKTNMLMSELAQVADQERTLLEECGDLLVVVSSFEVQERSLRMQVLQFEQEKERLLGQLMTGGD